MAANNNLDHGNVFVSGYDDAMDPGVLRKALEDLSGVACIHFSHKGSYSFFKFNGKALEPEIMKKIHGKLLSDGRQLSCQSVKKKHSKATTRLDKMDLPRTLCKLGKEFGYEVAENEMYLMERCARSLHVSDIPQHITEADMSEAFEQFGGVEESTLVSDRSSSIHKGYGFIVFMHHEAMIKFKRHSRQPVYCKSHAVRIQSARLAKTILSNGQAIGFFSADATITPMFCELIKAGCAEVKKNGGAVSQGAAPGPTTQANQFIYMKDVHTNQVIAFTPQELQYYMQQSQQLQMRSQQQQPQVRNPQQPLTRFTQQPGRQPVRPPMRPPTGALPHHGAPQNQAPPPGRPSVGAPQPQGPRPPSTMHPSRARMLQGRAPQNNPGRPQGSNTRRSRFNPF